jgi:hypothetical protein
LFAVSLRPDGGAIKLFTIVVYTVV